ncbi:CYTH domain-containing protein [Phenylobacterium sp.]|uniref:CYTH domain-containing protein n=1 Tax=Phenylobacterium sp. TaxID=1871053 RepID=UPI0039C9F88B
MTTEIERRFCVISDAWRIAASPGRILRQGYLAQTGVATVRVRREEHSAFLSVKSARCGIVREEFTAPLSVTDADFMLERLCRGVVLTKVRHEVKYSGQLWQIDVFGEGAEGLVIAEVELERPDQAIPLPPWVGKEVTKSRRYRNSEIARRCARRQAGDRPSGSESETGFRGELMAGPGTS